MQKNTSQLLFFIMLKGKKIVIGVSGSIAAYKTALLVRLLVKSGAEVKVIMTKAACDFITPLTLSTLSKNPVFTDFQQDPKSGLWNNHVELGLWADIMLVAPASANTIAKMANGICDNLLIATYLSARCKVFYAPAMDLDMYKHGSTLTNIKKLESFGNIMIKPGVGELASGLSGEGRMAEPEEILSFIEKAVYKKLPLSKKKVLITAGPTYEAIDPVRFIGNHATGKMGFALANAFAEAGADVTLVTGPTYLETQRQSIKRIDIVSAEQLYNVCKKEFLKSDIAVLSAAVADFKPSKVAGQKIKKSDTQLNIALVPTQDTLATLGKIKKKNQFLVGFALETNNELEHAKQKLKKKNLDLIVLNSLNDKGAGFGTDTNKITLIDKHNKIHNFGLKKKSEVAEDIVTFIIAKILKN